MNWFYSGWKFRKKITIDRTKVSGSTDLVNFPVLVNINDPNVRDNAQSTGIDLVITDSNNHLLDFELESYTQTTGQVVMWVRIPLLSVSRDTVIYLYYGNDNNTSLANPTGLWDSAVFRLVSHLQQDPSGTAPQITDSTGRYSGTSGGSMTASDSIASKIGRGLDFDGVNDGITYPGFAYGLQGTISFLAKKTSANDNLSNRCIYDSSSAARYILYKRGTADNSHGWYLNGTLILDGVGILVDLTMKDVDCLVHMTWDMSLSSQKEKVYKNGVLVANANVTITAGTPTEVYLGRRYSNEEFYQGGMDEFRIWNVAVTVDMALTEANNQLSPETFYTVSPQETKQQINKHFFYRVYDANQYVDTWTKEVTSEPSFRNTLNGGPGELIITLARSFDDFGEDVDVKLNNKVECYCVDKDSPNGQLIYSGYISGYRPRLNQASEYVEITVFGYVAELQRMILRDGSGNTTLTYNSYDPADIFKDVIDKYRSIGGSLNYSSTSINRTNTSVSYTFNTNTIKECLDKILELCPEGWYYRISPAGIVTLSYKNILADHGFTIGLDVMELDTFRRIEDVTNRVLFVGGGSPALFRKYENTGSQGTYGLYEKKIVDQRVTVAATAATIAQRELDARNAPEIRSTFKIADNNGPTSRGYDIESIMVGQTLKVNNLRAAVRTNTYWDVGYWDEDVWDQTLTASAADVIQILSTEYRVDHIIIEASSRLPQIAKRIEDIQRNLETTQMVNNPSAPS